jgi:cyclophilin family peptidyl-prolyl cis-trans isomerase
MVGDEATSGVAEIDAFIAEQEIDTSADGWRLGLPRPPQAAFEEGRGYFWELETNLGPISVRLRPDVAPMHASSTAYLTALGFYDGLSFHRVIDGFMAQGGCPEGTGTRGPGYQYDGEFDDSVRHDRPGLLSMANAGPGTDGSQFFLTFVETPWLDDKHTIFGQVESGMETVSELEKRGSRGGETSEPLRIDSARIRVE